MNKIGTTEIQSYFDDSPEIRKAKNDDIKRGLGHPVTGYLDLARKVAELQFRNPEHVLLFRGQSHDYWYEPKNHRMYSTLKPTLFRPKGGKGIAGEQLLSSRFALLNRAEGVLLERCSDHGNPLANELKLRRHRILRWAILQHYEICRTPLLDVTQSLRVAASFASAANSGQAFVYVLGVPNISGSVTASDEAGVQILRLSSICPPAAVRPHIQEGFLLGEYPEMPDVSQKQHYASFEIDFSRRLIAKFCFNPHLFWKGASFPKIARPALYPNKHDPIFAFAEKLRSELGLQE